MASPLDGSIGLDTTFDQRFGSWNGAPAAANDPKVLAQTKITQTDVTVGTEDTTQTTTRTETSTVGGAVGAYLIQGTVILLGLVFVAKGLSMFSEGGLSVR